MCIRDRDKGVPVICCGEPMQELKAGVTDAAVEKHVPVYTIEGSHVHVVVGETKHPMLEEHFIEWITLNTCLLYTSIQPMRNWQSVSMSIGRKNNGWM